LDFYINIFYIFFKKKNFSMINFIYQYYSFLFFLFIFYIYFVVRSNSFICLYLNVYFLFVFVSFI